MRSPTKLLDKNALTDREIQSAWEEAYTRFETPDEEIKKFVGRLKKLGQHEWKRDTQIVDIFCGRGNGLCALESLGFTNLEGVDISAELLALYAGPAKLYEADCRQMPLETESRDIVIVQGGLHHLPAIPDDLDQTLSEVHRILRPGGKFILVEPWPTPFLSLIHFLSERDLIKRVSGKFDAFAVMTHYEATTYFQWLGKSDQVLALLHKYFTETYSSKTLGKLFFIGTK